MVTKKYTVNLSHLLQKFHLGLLFLLNEYKYI